MKVPHNASVVVTDGRKALLLRNEGDTRFSNFQLVQKWQQRVEADRNLKSDGPGRSFSSHDRGTRRSSYSETDLHELAENQFLSEIAHALHGKAACGDLGQLVIVAPPRALGELRKYLSDDLAELVIAEIAKDLVKHSIADIEQLISKYSGAGRDRSKRLAEVAVAAAHER